MTSDKLTLLLGAPVIRATTIGTLVGGSIAGALFVTVTVAALALPPYHDRDAGALVAFVLGYLLLSALAGAVLGAVTGLLVGAVGWLRRRPRTSTQP